MYVIQSRHLINGTCGAPILAPSVEIAKRQVGRMISENPILKDRPDGASLDIICEWDPGDGILDNLGKPSKCFRVISGSECLAAYQHAFDAINTPGEGEWSADDGEEVAQ